MQSVLKGTKQPGCLVEKAVNDSVQPQSRDLSPYVVSLVLRKALTEAYLQCFRNTLPTSLAQNTFHRKLFRMAVCLTCLGLSGGLEHSARRLRGTNWALIIHLRAAQNRAWQNSSFEWGGGRVQFDHAFQTRCPGYLKGPEIYFRHSHEVEQGATCTFDGRLPRAMGAPGAPSDAAKARSCARRQQNGAHVTNPSLTAFIPRGRLHLVPGESRCQKTIRPLSLRAEPLLPTAHVLHL